jgi:hypothetical protein
MRGERACRQFDADGVGSMLALGAVRRRRVGDAVGSSAKK